MLYLICKMLSLVCNRVSFIRDSFVNALMEISISSMLLRQHGIRFETHSIRTKNITNTKLTWSKYNPEQKYTTVGTYHKRTQKL